MCDLAIKNSCEMIFISTDKAVRPTNIMGATKRFAEMILQAIAKIEEDKKKKQVEKLSEYMAFSEMTYTNSKGVEIKLH